jgi:MFS family permease
MFDEGQEDSSQLPFMAVLAWLRRCRSYVLIVAAASVQSLSGYSVLVWGPAFLGRVHGLDGIEIGTWLGIMIGVAGCLGGYLGGKWSDHAGRRDVRWYMRAPALQSIMGVPFVIGFTLLDDARWALWCFFPFYALGAMYVGPMLSTVQSLVQLRMRATASALLLFVLNMVGLGLGPLLVGAMNDYLFSAHGDHAIRYSLLVMGLLGGCASVLFWLASNHLRADMARVADR